MAAVAQPVAKSSFEHLVLDFLAYLEFERGLSRNTLEAYRSDLLQYGRYLEGHDTTAVDATGRQIGSFLAALDGAKGGAASSAERSRSSRKRPYCSRSVR